MEKSHTVNIYGCVQCTGNMYSISMKKISIFWEEDILCPHPVNAVVVSSHPLEIKSWHKHGRHHHDHHHHQRYTLCPKKRPPIYFANNSQKFTDLMIFGGLNHGKI